MVTRVAHNHETAGSIPALATNYRTLSEVIAEWRADPARAALMDRYRDDARAYFRDHPPIIIELEIKR